MLNERIAIEFELAWHEYRVRPVQMVWPLVARSVVLRCDGQYECSEACEEEGVLHPLAGTKA
jgi:hypothetical protein